MADLGAIADSYTAACGALTRTIPSARQYVYDKFSHEGGLQDLLNLDVSGTISGVVQIGGVNAANVKCVLIHRSGPLIVAEALTNSSGAYSFTGLDKNDLASYLVLFIDPLTGTPFNYTLARDHLTAG